MKRLESRSDEGSSEKEIRGFLARWPRCWFLVGCRETDREPCQKAFEAAEQEQIRCRAEAVLHEGCGEGN